MGAHGLPGPHGAHLVGGTVADGENEIELRRSGGREFLPGLGAQLGRVVVELPQKIHGVRMNSAARLAAGAEPLEAAGSQSVDYALSDERARRVMRAEK